VDKGGIRDRGHAQQMATREGRLQRGRRRGRSVTARLVGELAATRVVSGVSQRALARELGCSQSAISRLEALRRPEDIPLVRLAEIASLLGLELSAGLHPHGDALLDEGHLALIRRFRARLSPTISISTEVPFPLPGDQNSGTSCCGSAVGNFWGSRPRRASAMCNPSSGGCTAASGMVVPTKSCSFCPTAVRTAGWWATCGWRSANGTRRRRDCCCAVFGPVRRCRDPASFCSRPCSAAAKSACE
jgi:transcriptional regulator with XRE-family HTH domain